MPGLAYQAEGPRPSIIRQFASHCTGQALQEVGQLSVLHRLMLHHRLQFAFEDTKSQHRSIGRLGEDVRLCVTESRQQGDNEYVSSAVQRQSTAKFLLLSPRFADSAMSSPLTSREVGRHRNCSARILDGRPIQADSRPAFISRSTLAMLPKCTARVFAAALYHVLAHALFLRSSKGQPGIPRSAAPAP